MLSFVLRRFLFIFYWQPFIWSRELPQQKNAAPLFSYRWIIARFVFLILSESWKQPGIKSMSRRKNF